MKSEDLAESRESLDRDHLEALRLTPSEFSWRVELEKIFDGFRDRILFDQGDASNYVEDLIAQAVDPALSRVKFLDAFERQVECWRFGRGDGWMLDLLARYTPPAGYLKVVQMFEPPGGFAGDPDPTQEYFEGTPLRLRALHALERYLPAPPLFSEQWPHARLNYDKYVAILTEHLRYPVYEGYSRGRLSVLGVKESSREETLAPESPSPRYVPSPELLKEYYLEALQGGEANERILHDRVEQLGGKLVYQQQGVLLKLSTAESVAIEIDPKTDVYELHFERFMRNNNLELERLTLVAGGL